ncbi:MAG: hybrid sensor histidine kinase/response regulator [Desulfatiglandaceae bacterium]|jgi:signal transduction histidine kinase
MIIERGRVLVVDDEEIIRDSCARALKKEGHIVRTAADGHEGVKVFQEFHPDLVLIDLKMPGKDGIEVLKEMEEMDPDAVKIIVTGYATISLAVDAMKKGAYDFLAKPSTPDEIRLAVRRGLEKRNLLLERAALRREQEKIRRNMISLVSHELRSPLAATVQYLEVILGGMAGEISDDVKEMMARCSERLREMLDLVHRWLSLATFDSFKMSEQFEDTSLLDIAREAISSSKPLADENGVALSLEAPADLSPIKGSKIPLEETFNNLISNAIKYNRQNGWVKVILYGKDEEIFAEIRDNGTGIGREHLDRIFDEFYRVDGRRNSPIKGSGLGLSIVKKMVEAHGGFIEVDSTEGRGTTFTMRFPKAFQGTKRVQADVGGK